MTKKGPNFIFGHAGGCFEVDLEKKFFRRKSIFSVEIGIFRRKSLKIGSKNRGNRANTTSSYPKFCQDSENAQLFDPRGIARSENRVFVKQGCVQK